MVSLKIRKNPFVLKMISASVLLSVCFTTFNLNQLKFFLSFVKKINSKQLCESVELLENPFCDCNGLVLIIKTTNI